MIMKKMRVNLSHVKVNVNFRAINFIILAQNSRCTQDIFNTLGNECFVGVGIQL